MSTDIEVGSVWRERRREYAKRTVRVTGADNQPLGNGFINIETITTASGQPPKHPIRTRVRQQLWRRTFEPAGFVSEGEQ